MAMAVRLHIPVAAAKSCYHTTSALDDPLTRPIHQRNARVLGLIPNGLEHGQGTTPAFTGDGIGCNNWGTISMNPTSLGADILAADR